MNESMKKLKVLNEAILLVFCVAVVLGVIFLASNSPFYGILSLSISGSCLFLYLIGLMLSFSVQALIEDSKDRK